MTRMDWDRPKRERALAKPPVADLIRWRRITLRFPGQCVFCARGMKRGNKAAFEPESRSVACISCAEGRKL